MTDAAFGGENAESYYDEGLTSSMKGDVNRAIECFKRAIQMDNSFAAAYHQLGKCYTRMGEHQRAAKLLAQVVLKHPEIVAARIDHGYALNGMGQYSAAREHFEAVLASDRQNARAMLGLAHTDFEEGKWDNSLNHAQAAETAGGGNFANLYMVGRAAKLAGQPQLSVMRLQKADKVIEKYVETNPDKPEGHFLRGEVAFVRESFQTALQHYCDAEDRAVRNKVYLAYGEHFTVEDILAKEALCYQRLDKIDRARELGERIGEMNSDHRLGIALRKL